MLDLVKVKIRFGKSKIPLTMLVHDSTAMGYFHSPGLFELAQKLEHGVLRKLKHIFPNTYQRIKSICSPAKGGTGCYRFNYQPGS